MKQDAPKIEALRRAFRDACPTEPQSGTDLPQRSCPTADHLWAAATGDLSLLDRYRVIDHLTQCPACTLAWRLAMDLRDEERETGYGRTGDVIRMTDRVPRPVFAGLSRRQRRFAVPIVSAAATVLLAVGLMFFPGDDRQDAPVVTRGTVPVSTDQIASPVDAREVPRDEFVLEWTPGPAGTTYDVQVLTEDLQRIIVEFEDLRSNNVEIPEDLLAEVTSGSELQWTVNAELPSGDSNMGTFSSTIK